MQLILGSPTGQPARGHEEHRGHEGSDIDGTRRGAADCGQNREAAGDAEQRGMDLTLRDLAPGEMRRTSSLIRPCISLFPSLFASRDARNWAIRPRAAVRQGDLHGLMRAFEQFLKYFVAFCVWLGG